MLQWLNKLYTEGLLDKEFASQQANTWQEKLTNNKAGAFVDWMSRSDQLQRRERRLQESDAGL